MVIITLASNIELNGCIALHTKQSEATDYFIKDFKMKLIIINAFFLQCELIYLIHLVYTNQIVKAIVYATAITIIELSINSYHWRKRNKR